MDFFSSPPKKNNTPSLFESTESPSSSNESIQIFIRLRPFLPEEKRKESCCEIINDRKLQINYPAETTREFSFDKVFGEDTTQEKVFKEICLPLLNNALRGGQNGACIVYGQTGAGKTYTMGLLDKLGENSMGLIPYAMRFIFKEIENFDISIRVSCLQIYLDEISDLFNPRGKPLMIREDSTGNPYLQDLCSVEIQNVSQAFSLINVGLKNRKTGAQGLNETSSRSHVVLTLHINRKGQETRISFVDLAGSERIKKSNSVGLRLQEAKFINLSLSALGNVISSLTQNKNKFIPFRQSKLTRILQGCLNGEGKLALIANCSQGDNFAAETLSTIMFAMRCREIKFKPIVKIDPVFSNSEHKMFQEHLERELSNLTKIYKRNEIEYQRQINELQEKVSNKSIPSSSISPKKTDTDSDVYSYLLKLLPRINENAHEFIEETLDLRKSLKKDIFSYLADSFGQFPYNFSLGTSHNYLVLNSFFNKIDEEYPEIKSVFQDVNKDDFNNSVKKEKIVSNIQNTAKQILGNIKNLANSTKDLEKIKLELLVQKFISDKREEELNNWTEAIAFLLKNCKELKRENLKLTQKKVDEFEIEFHMNEFSKNIEEKVVGIINQNNCYKDLEFYKEKIGNALKPKKLYQDNTLAQTLSLLRDYSNNSFWEKKGIDEKEKEDVEENKQIKSMIENIYQKELKKSDIFHNEINKSKGFEEDFSQDFDESNISLNELTKIKKDKRINESRNLYDKRIHKEKPVESLRKSENVTNFYSNKVEDEMEEILNNLKSYKLDKSNKNYPEEEKIFENS